MGVLGALRRGDIGPAGAVVNAALGVARVPVLLLMGASNAAQGAWTATRDVLTGVES